MCHHASLCLDTEREDMRRIRELTSMNQDIENNSVIGNSSYKDCRPISEGQGSIFTNSTIAEHQKTTLRSVNTAKGGLKKQAKYIIEANPTSLVINKTMHEKDQAKRAL